MILANPRTPGAPGPLARSQNHSFLGTVQTRAAESRGRQAFHLASLYFVLVSSTARCVRSLWFLNQPCMWSSRPQWPSVTSDLSPLKASQPALGANSCHLHPAAEQTQVTTADQGQPTVPYSSSPFIPVTKALSTTRSRSLLSLLALGCWACCAYSAPLLNPIQPERKQAFPGASERHLENGHAK